MQGIWKRCIKIHRIIICNENCTKWKYGKIMIITVKLSISQWSITYPLWFIQGQISIEFINIDYVYTQTSHVYIMKK